MAYLVVSISHFKALFGSFLHNETFSTQKAPTILTNGRWAIVNITVDIPILTSAVLCLFIAGAHHFETTKNISYEVRNKGGLQPE